MSALTKIAVVLLVIASLLLSAGVVVFVNKVEDFSSAADVAKKEATKEREAHNQTKLALDAANANALQTAQALNARIDALKQSVSTSEAAALDLKNQVTAKEQEKKAIEVNLATVAQTLKAAQEQGTAYQQQIADLRTARDKLVSERHAINTELTDTASKLDATEKQRKMLAEQVAGMRAQLGDIESKVKMAGFTTGTLPVRTNDGAPALEGVVSTVFSAGNKPWASISIGSKDNVTKDMKFNVINNNEFLGYLIIQSTEPNEAAGVLEGPKVDKVKNGDLVKTQLQ